MRPLIKICGITHADDARAAAAAGADAIGLVFAASPRRVSTEQARALAAATPAGVLRVGVFVETGEDEIAAIAAATGLDAVQLLGPRSPGAAAGLAGWPIWRGLRLPDEAGAAAAWEGTAAALLVEAAGERYGGTGVSWDWGLARALPTRLPRIVAGGLTAENVTEAIHASHADGVDVCSGVEAAPGRKDAARMSAFIAAARAAFAAGWA